MADPKDEMEAWKAAHSNLGASNPVLRAEIERVQKHRQSITSKQRTDLIPKHLRDAEGKGGEAEKALREAKRAAGLCTDKWCYAPREDASKARCDRHLIDRQAQDQRLRKVRKGE